MKIYRHILNHPGQRQDFLKSFLVKSGQNLILDTTMDFQASRTSGRTVIKVVVMPHAQADLTGLIKIKPRLKQINAFLKHQVLLIWTDSTAVSTPKLEIESDDVIASHAAVISPLDQNQIFYLMSRGFSQTQAVKLIINSFLTSHEI